MSDEHERDQQLRPPPVTRGFESMDTDTNRHAREALREEGVERNSGEDSARDAVVHDLTSHESRPLTREEREAAERDPGRPERVYAPASERVPKDPIPGDDRLIHHG